MNYKPRIYRAFNYRTGEFHWFVPYPQSKSDHTITYEDVLAYRKAMWFVSDLNLRERENRNI